MSTYRGTNVPVASMDKDSSGDRRISKRPSDPIFYLGKASKVLGAFHLVAGLLSMALGVGAICTFASGYHIGYGIWAGFIFTLTAIFTITTSYYRNACMVTTTMIFCLLSSVCGVAQFSLGVVATVNDRFRSSTGELSWDERYLQHDIYYRRNNPFNYLYSYYCTDTYGAFTWNQSWAPVDILLLLVGIIEAMLAIASAALCCYSFCRGDRRVSITTRSTYVTLAEKTEFEGSYYNGGYDNGSRLSEPTLMRIPKQ